MRPKPKKVTTTKRLYCHDNKIKIQIFTPEKWRSLYKNFSLDRYRIFYGLNR